MRILSALLLVMMSTAVSVSAQTEGELKQYFEGRNVTLKIDMPATKDGVNVYPERSQPFNYSEYGTRLKRFGTSVRRGDVIMVTKVKVKDKHIEFQLGGGGYGTFGDETEGPISVPNISKSRRERSLEEELARESDPQRRKRLRNELDDLRRKREREDQRNRLLAAQAEEARRERIEEKALQGGARFNIHLSRIESWMLTPSMLIDALRRYLEFGDSVAGASHIRLSGGSVRYGVIQLGPRTTYLKEGVHAQDVLRLLGEPSSVFQRSEEGAVVTTYEFSRSNGRKIVAEFVNNKLVRSRTETVTASPQGRT